MALPGLWKALKILWSQSADAKTALILSAVTAYAKVQPENVRSNGEKTKTSPIDRLREREVNLRMKDGSTFRCRMQDSGALLSVYLEEDYDVPGLQWQDMTAIVDIGAHIGVFSVWAGRRAPRAKIVCVEPNPEVSSFLEQNLEANSLSGRNMRIQAALGPVSGSGYLDNRGTSLGARIITSDQGVRVPLMTLEQIVDRAGFAEVDFLKVDCEGSEYSVLLEAPHQLLSRIRVLVCEYHPGAPSDLTGLTEGLEAAGFSVHKTNGEVGLLTAVRR